MLVVAGGAGLRVAEHQLRRARRCARRARPASTAPSRSAATAGRLYSRSREIARKQQVD